MIEIVFVVCIIVLIVLWLFEMYMTRKLEDAYNRNSELATDFIDAFNQIKETINSNADSLRGTIETVNRHDKLIMLMDSMQSFQNEVLKINPSLRARLEEEVDLRVEKLDD